MKNLETKTVFVAAVGSRQLLFDQLIQVFAGVSLLISPVQEEEIDLTMAKNKKLDSVISSATRPLLERSSEFYSHFSVTLEEKKICL